MMCIIRFYLFGSFVFFFSDCFSVFGVLIGFFLGVFLFFKGDNLLVIFFVLVNLYLLKRYGYL